MTLALTDIFTLAVTLTLTLAITLNHYQPYPSGVYGLGVRVPGFVSGGSSLLPTAARGTVGLSMTLGLMRLLRSYIMHSNCVDQRFMVTIDMHTRTRR